MPRYDDEQLDLPDPTYADLAERNASLARALAATVIFVVLSLVLNVVALMRTGHDAERIERMIDQRVAAAVQTAAPAPDLGAFKADLDSLRSAQAASRTLMAAYQNDVDVLGNANKSLQEQLVKLQLANK